MGKVNDVTLFNAVRQMSPDTYKDRIPLATQETIQHWGIALTTDQFKSEFNCFIDVLFNKIGYTVVKDCMHKGRIENWKQPEWVYGDAFEEIFVDIVKSLPYDCKGAEDQFEKFKADNVHVMYHRRTREEYYPVTIQRATMQKAFNSATGFFSLVSKMLAQMVNSNRVDEYLLFKQMMVTYRYNTARPLLPTQFITTPDVTDKGSAEKFVKALQTAIVNTSYPSRLYNPSKVYLESTSGELDMFTLASIQPILNVDLIANAFNKDSLMPTIKHYMLDDFGDSVGGKGNDDVLAIVGAHSLFSIYNNLLEVTEARNSRGLYENHFYHIWQTYAASTFEQAIYIIKE